MVVVDTDVLLLAFAFHRDDRQTANHQFLRHAEPLALILYSLMELLGKLSFNLSAEQLDSYPSWLLDAYQLTLLSPFSPDRPLSFTALEEELYGRPFARMRVVQMPFVDGLIIGLAERTPGVTHFVTWNARHFRAKTTLSVLTPAEYLEVGDRA